MYKNLCACVHISFGLSRLIYRSVEVRYFVYARVHLKQLGCSFHIDFIAVRVIEFRPLTQGPLLLFVTPEVDLVYIQTTHAKTNSVTFRSIRCSLTGACKVKVMNTVQYQDIHLLIYTVCAFALKTDLRKVRHEIRCVCSCWLLGVHCSHVYFDFALDIKRFYRSVCFHTDFSH